MADKDQAPHSATCYSRLDPKLAQFRTIVLLPGVWSDIIQCQLRVHPLDKAPYYETISYAWGDPEDTRQIIVDGVHLAIPSSLELCLRHLRSPESALTDLWADAICIDQTNLEERCIQVSNMGAIYWRCSAMYIWLGMPHRSTDARSPFEMVTHWAEGKHFYQLPGFSKSKESGEWGFQENPEYQQMFELFTDFTSKPWWTRLWCIQEIALSPAATVVLGKWRLPWATIVSALQTHYHHASTCCADASAVMPAKYTYFSDHLLFLSQQSDLTELDSVFRAFRHKLCKDPRDKIYGLLGLLWKNRDINLRPDYNLPVGKVYLQATEAIISQSAGDLQFLTGLGLNSDCHHLPSWIRNFAAPLTTVEASYERSRYRRYSCYQASAGAKSDISIVDGNDLSLRGVFVDRIQRIGNSIQNRDWTHVWEALQNWADVAELPALGQGHVYGVLQQHFWRTIMADVSLTDLASGSWNRILTPTVIPIEDWFLDTVDNLRQGLEPPVTSSVHALYPATYGRALFRTESGHFGLCFPDARPGDEVWVLAGGRVPFVLRGLNNTTGSTTEAGTGPESFRLVGECYLHGFMDGEALRADDILIPIHLK
ncbi:hypothetical protein ST47_g3927 [Ascochyta rabiei]|uniref:Heterokaryon incompatibility domain-containing protein n=1 Tax=Didymella rabiei TaxID=5454 RepID=A0A163GMZ1_DIDRA|nr:hypothetical protein ST47_g3927 [Ascochyta rabiei]